MVYGGRWMPYDGHPIELGDGRRVPLETLLAEARRLRAAELRSLWSGVRRAICPLSARVVRPGATACADGEWGVGRRGLAGC
jgi:hypothetical protein